MENNSTDMMAEARNAQWSALAFLGQGSVRAVAPAKVNLFLGVGGQLEGGYHEVATVMHALALHDTLYINCIDAENFPCEYADAATDAEAGQIAMGGPAENLLVSITISDKTAGLGRMIEAPLQVPVSENLAFKAVDALARKIGHTKRQMVKIHIEKQIPSQAGLGGGSADAAATLAAMTRFWNICDRCAQDDLLSVVASSLGADVAFFLKGGCGFYDGAGEVFQHSLEASSLPVVLVKPPLGISTKEAYREFDRQPCPPSESLLAEAANAKAAAEVPLFNSLEPAAFSVVPELAAVQEWLADEIAAARSTSEEASKSDLMCRPLLTGSGSATFAAAESFTQASSIAAAAQAKGWWSRATTLSKLRATIVEA